jgi:hypothetical protein
MLLEGMGVHTHWPFLRYSAPDSSRFTHTLNTEVPIR